MGKIEYVTGTLNFQSGCTEARLEDGSMSPECRLCYARLLSARIAQMYTANPAMLFSKALQDRFFLYRDAAVRSGGHARWTRNLFWDADLLRAGFAALPRGSRTFVGDMTDLFHDDCDPEMWRALAAELKRLPMDRTVLLLTKRPCNLLTWQRTWFSQGIPKHIWVGVTAGCQASVDERLPVLMQVQAATRWVSVEPMTTAIRLEAFLGNVHEEDDPDDPTGRGLSWVVCGGEAGAKAAPMDPAWVRALRDQCRDEETPFFFKQWGGANKKAAGRLLDGQTWDQLPMVTT